VNKSCRPSRDFPGVELQTAQAAPLAFFGKCWVLIAEALTASQAGLSPPLSIPPETVRCDFWSKHMVMQSTCNQPIPVFPLFPARFRKCG